jgi:hypothetical protein
MFSYISISVRVETRDKLTLPPSTFSKVFMTSNTLLLISSFDKPAEAAYPLVNVRVTGRAAATTVGRRRGVEATRKEGAARAIADRNIVLECVGE